MIARGPSDSEPVSLEEVRGRNLYAIGVAPTETSLTERVALVQRADKAARDLDSRIFQVQAVYADNLREKTNTNQPGKADGASSHLPQTSPRPQHRKALDPDRAAVEIAA